MRLLQFVVMAALCCAGVLAKAEPKAKPEPKPGVLSVVKKSTTHFPNHYSSHISSLNVDPARSHYNSYNPLHHQVAHLPYYNYLNTVPYLNTLPPYQGALGGPSYYNKNLYNPAYLNGGLYGSYDHTKNLLSYSLSPGGDGGWSFVDGAPIAPPAVNPLRYTNPYNGWASSGVYPGLLSQHVYPLPATLALAGSGLYPFNNMFNLSALDRLKWNSKYLSDEIPFHQSGSVFDRPQIVSAAVHNAHALGKSKESEYGSKNAGD